MDAPLHESQLTACGIRTRVLQGGVNLRATEAVVFVHGCFWHGHTCRYFRWPASRPEFWRAKIGRNQFNDAAALDALQQMGWRVAVVWECAMRGKSVQDVNDLGAAVGAWLASDAVSLVLPVELS